VGILHGHGGTLLLGTLVDEGLVNVRNDTTTSNGCLQEACSTCRKLGVRQVWLRLVLTASRYSTALHRTGNHGFC
jgi:hypothetical protein